MTRMFRAPPPLRRTRSTARAWSRRSAGMFRARAARTMDAMPIYLDHAATSPLRPQVLAAYTAALPLVGNPSSIHGHGQAARELLEQGRDKIAASLGADTAEVVLTGGGPETGNLGIKGLFWARNAGRVAADALAGRVAAEGGVSRPTPRPRILVPL